MTFREILDSGAGQFMAAQQFVNAGITLEDNTTQEIVDVVNEMADGISDDDHLAFWSQYPLKAISPYNGKPIHGADRVSVGREFLKGYV